MSLSKLNELIKQKNILITDGATGTNLMQMGLPNGATAEHWVLENPDAIYKLHMEFIGNGSEVILTSTFGASKLRLEQSGLEDHFISVNEKAVEIARQAIKGTDVMVAGSMGPLGHFLKPVGLVEEFDAQNFYGDQARVLSESGVDLILIETQFDIVEAAAAVRGATSASDLPVICSFSFDRGTKTMMGVSPSDFYNSLSGLGIFGLGINCGKSLDDNQNVLLDIHKISQFPIWFKPNAGLPKINKSGQTEYDVTPEKMANMVEKWVVSGAQFIGGCCGTTPLHIKAIAEAVHAIR